KQPQALEPPALIIPVVGHEDERAESAYLVPELEQPASDLLGTAGDDDLVEEIIQVAVGIAHTRIAFPHPKARAAPRELQDVLNTLAQGVAAGEATGLGRRVRDEDVAGDLPVTGLDRVAGRVGAGAVGLPVIAEHTVSDHVVADRQEAAGAGVPQSR